MLEFLDEVQRWHANSELDACFALLQICRCRVLCSWSSIILVFRCWLTDAGLKKTTLSTNAANPLSPQQPTTLTPLKYKQVVFHKFFN